MDHLLNLANPSQEKHVAPFPKTQIVGLYQSKWQLHTHYLITLDNGSLTLMSELPLSFNSQYNILMRPTEKIYFPCQLEIVKYFHKLTMWGEVWLEIW